MFRLENMPYLYALLVIPAYLIIFVLSRISRRKRIANFADPALAQKLMPESSKYKAYIKFYISMLTIIFLVIGITNPQIGTKMEEYKREGLDIIIALDVSNSMMAEDIKPNRLTRAKQSINKLVDNLRSDRIGLIVFAGNSFLQHPLTSDYSAAKLLLSTVDTGIIPTQGTAIGGAIDLAIDAFEEDDSKQKLLIVITDGENHEDDALGAAKKAAEEGIVIHTIGMGSAKGAPIPEYKNGKRSDFIKDRSGTTVISKLDARMLQELAAEANGQFIRSAGTDPDLNKLIEDMDKMERTEYEAKVFSDYEDRFQYFIAIALLLLILETLISDKKNRFIADLKFFDSKK